MGHITKNLNQDVLPLLGVFAFLHLENEGDKVVDKAEETTTWLDVWVTFMEVTSVPLVTLQRAHFENLAF